MAHSKHLEVAAWYEDCCGYCGTSEVDVGGALTVDHYEPVSAGGNDSDENLVYACVRCNLYKGDYFPDAAARAAGQIILHPLRDNVSLHFRENEWSGELEPLTETGRFHIAQLHLNRRQLVVGRQRRWLRRLSEETRNSLAAELEDMQTEVTATDAIRNIWNVCSAGVPGRDNLQAKIEGKKWTKRCIKRSCLCMSGRHGRKF